MWQLVDALHSIHIGRVSVEHFESMNVDIVSLADSARCTQSVESYDVSAHHIAYVITTSGTTGVPKIVRVPHQCIVPNIRHIRYFSTATVCISILFYRHTLGSALC